MDVTRIQNLITSYSANRLSQYCRGLAIRAEELAPERAGPTGAYGEEMSLILISGNSGTIILKTHFDIAVARRLAAHTYERPETEVSDEIACEFIKEYSNLLAGAFRGAFEKYGLLMGMSLPFLSPGDDEVLYQKARESSIGHGLWTLASDLGAVVCSAEIKLANPDEIALLTILSDRLAASLLKEEHSNSPHQPATEQDMEGQFEFL